MNNKRDFYKRVSEDRLRNTRARSNVRTIRNSTYRESNSRQCSRNYNRGNIREEEYKTSFFSRLIMFSLVIVGLLLLSSHFKEELEPYIPEQVQNILEKFDLEKVKDKVTIDDKTIEDMEKQIGNDIKN